MPALIVAVAGVVAVIRARRRKEERQEHAAILLWGLWLIIVTVVFSASEEVQSYYFGILSPAIAALCALGAKAALDRFGVFPWRLGFTLGVTGAALWSAVVLFEAGAAWHATALGIGAAALVAGAAAIGLTAAGPPGQRTRIALGRISLALTLAAGLASPVIADCWLVMHRAGPFDIPLSPSGTFTQSTPSAVATRLAHPGYDGTILGEVTAATWQRFQTLGPEYNNGIPPGTWLAVYSSATASNYVLAGVQRVLSGFGDTTAKAQLYTCLDP